MKYSLRSLMILVTLVCVMLGILGARSEGLRRKAVFHEQKREIARGRQISAREQMTFDYHDAMANDYRRAMWHPWVVVKEPFPLP